MLANALSFPNAMLEPGKSAQTKPLIRLHITFALATIEVRNLVQVQSGYRNDEGSWSKHMKHSRHEPSEIAI